MSKPDAVNNPEHYNVNGMEAIDVIEKFGLGFCLGNTVKYVLRAGRKGDAIEDLKKARWYLDREISNLAPSRCKCCGHSDHDGKKCLQALRHTKPGTDYFCLCEPPATDPSPSTEVSE